MAAAQFFNPWEPSPTYAPPPSDAALVQRITKLADYAARNGPQFIKVMEGKQKDNPEFAFLFGGDGYDYYRWTLFTMIQQQHAAPAPVQQPAPAAPAAATQPHPYSLPPEVESGFSQVLEALSGSKDSIKNSQSWFMHCAPYAAGMAYMMALRVLQLPEYDRQLHVIYLANDILFKSLSQRQQPGGEAAADHVARSFLPFLGAMLAAACTTGGKTDEVKQRLGKILLLWTERRVYDPSAIAAMEQAMHHGDAAATLSAAYAAATAAAAAAAAPPPQAPAPAPQGPPVTSAPPPQGVPSSTGVPPASQAYPAPPHHATPDQYSANPWQSAPGQPATAAGAPPPAWHVQPPPAGAYPPPGMAATPTTPPGMAPGPWPQPAMAGGPPAMYPPPHGPGAPWGAGHTSPRPPYPPAHPLPHPGAMPPHGMPPHPHHPPPHPHAPAPPPVPPPSRPVSSFNFPPGLIPQLVKEKSEHSRPYSPLSPLDIEKAGLPPPPEKDAYLSSRLDRFHAELAEYRPGLTRTDPEERLQERDRRGADPPAHAGRWAGPRSRRRNNSEREEAFDDGSFGGGGLGSGAGSMYAGLGSTSHKRGGDQRPPGSDPEEEDDDMYSQYRRIRSGAYHDFLAKNIQAAMKGSGR